MYRVFIYRRTGNLGDAFQTVALARLLGRCQGVYRDETIPETGSQYPLIANGWLGYRPPDLETDAIFAGVHIARHHAQFAEWMRYRGRMVGARDPATASILRGTAPTEMVGCATLTFDRYRGPRKGRYSIDVRPVPGTTVLTQSIGDLTWQQQWNLAVRQLQILRRAELIYTSRLHVILPCLAFGTPVVFPLSSLDHIDGRERLSLLDQLPFAFGQPVTADVSGMSHRFIAHVERNLTTRRLPMKKVVMPQPLSP